MKLVEDASRDSWLPLTVYPWYLSIVFSRDSLEL